MGERKYIQLDAILLRAGIELFDDNNVNLGEVTKTAHRENLTTVQDIQFII